MTVEKPMPKWAICLLRPITTPEKSAMNQLEFLSITWNLLKVVDSFTWTKCDCHWLKKNWREIIKQPTYI